MSELEPRYRQIVAAIRQRIESGELRPGDPVPSARAITADWGVAIATATKAHAALRAAGLTVARPGVGTVVSGSLASGSGVAGSVVAGPALRRNHELTKERIVTAAITIADHDGLTELSMRRIATALNVSNMALYRYVSSRDDLILAMIDKAIGEVELPPSPPNAWRSALQLCARLEWECFKLHPWLAPAMSLTRPQLAPNALRISEWVLTALDGTGLTITEQMYIQILLFTFVRGVATALEPEAEAVRETGLTNDQWMATQMNVLSAVLAETPMTRFEKLATTDFDFNLDTLFEFGLARFLDGLVPYLKTKAQPGP